MKKDTKDEEAKIEFLNTVADSFASTVYSKPSAYNYINNNYLVSVTHDTLTKRAFRIGEDLVSEFPDSIDLKLTNKCSNNCPYCHENSVPGGKSFNLEKTIEIISQLPPKPIELAIGGGNILEDPENVANFLQWCFDHKFRTRITLNVRDLDGIFKVKDVEVARKLLHIPDAVGVSIESVNGTNNFKIDRNSRHFIKTCFVSHVDREILGDLFTSFRVVYHIIAGVFPCEDLEKIIFDSNYPVLILGYKHWGRAKNMEIPQEKIYKFEKEIKRILYKLRAYGKPKVVCFDNLALDQLNIRDSLSDYEIESHYLGSEGSCSMYIDAVEGFYSRTSRDPERVSWDSVGLLEFFNSLKQ